MRKISMFTFEILQPLRERYRISTVEYSHSELFVVTGTAVSVISCISFVDSSPNLPFSHPFVCRRNLASHKKFDICCINFHIRSNVGIMAGNRDTVNQSESWNCIMRG